MSGGDKNCREEIRQRRAGSWFSAMIRKRFTDGGIFYKDWKEVREQDMEMLGKAVQRSIHANPCEVNLVSAKPAGG